MDRVFGNAKSLFSELLAILLILAIPFLVFFCASSCGAVILIYEVGFGDIIIASATITLMIVTIYRSHRDAIDSKILNLRENKIESFSYSLETTEILQRMGVYYPVEENSMLFEIIYDGRMSAYYSVTPLQVIIEKTSKDGIEIRERRKIKNYRPFFKDITKNGFLIEAEFSEALLYFSGIQMLSQDQQYTVIIDYKYQSLYSSGIFIKQFRDALYFREKIQISPEDRELQDDSGCLGVRCKVDYLLRERMPLCE